MARAPECSYPSWPWGRGVPLSHHSPLEGESQKPSREATADAVGGILSPKAARLATFPPPPTGSPAGCALGSPTPPQGGSDTKEGPELTPLPSRERKFSCRALSPIQRLSVIPDPDRESSVFASRTQKKEKTLDSFPTSLIGNPVLIVGNGGLERGVIFLPRPSWERKFSCRALRPIQRLSVIPDPDRESSVFASRTQKKEKTLDSFPTSLIGNPVLIVGNDERRDRNDGRRGGGAGLSGYVLNPPIPLVRGERGTVLSP